MWPPRAPAKIATAAWRFNVELSYEHRSALGFTVRPYVGAAYLLNRDDGVCDAQIGGCAEHADDPTTLAAHTGFAVGYVFE